MKPISAAPTDVDTRDMLVVHGALRRAHALLPRLRDHYFRRVHGTSTP